MTNLKPVRHPEFISGSLGVLENDLPGDAETSSA
jgi:hypothetical protein